MGREQKTNIQTEDSQIVPKPKGKGLLHNKNNQIK